MFADGETVGRMLLALCAALAVMTGVAGCGGDEGVPSGSVATVDGEPIERQSFDHWLNVVAKSGGQPNGTVPTPPDYANCDKPKQECKAQYATLRDQALQLLVSARWIEGEASDRDISIEDSEVEKAFEEQKKLSFPKEADFEKWLKASGQTTQDVLMRVRFDLLSNKLREHVTKDEKPATEAKINAYYRQNRQRFGEPAQRDLQLVLAKTRADADAAIADLKSGSSWSAVAKQYSIDKATKADGGRLEDVAEGQHEKPLDEAIFKAPKGQIRGPVKTKFGYYVFAVTDVKAPSQQTLEQAKPTIEQLMAAESEQKALEGFVERFRRKWRERTECLEGFLTPDCSNGPEPTATPAQPTTDAAGG